MKNSPQPWTKLVETKVENLVNSRNDSSFQIPNSPPYPLISMLNLPKFCCQKPKTLPATLIWGAEGLFHWKIDFLVCLNSFVQDGRSNKKTDYQIWYHKFPSVLTLCVIFLTLPSLRKKWPYSELFWSAFFLYFPLAFGLNTENISPYSVRMRENVGKMRTRITQNTDTFYAVKVQVFTLYILLLYLWIWHVDWSLTANE